MTHVNVNIHGQITLPAFIRKKHRIGTSTVLEVAERDSEIILRKAAFVKEDVLKELEALAKQRHITQKDVVKICREIGRKVYAEQYGE
ncbi:MAG: AbrB/MazE/SpoVT family DNA-binding domain-containing protein [Candidatus Diapherotrites archaeon]|nr:AbrB/MazE/SpoVT family DNA-binding domain-containing protein [Candidatus Diapherotrites archaeon]